MTAKIRYAVDGSGIYIDYEGVVTGRELLDTVTANFENARFSSLEFWLSDRTRVRQFNVSTEVTHAIGKMTSIYLGQNPIIVFALVCPSDIEFGLSRMIGIAADRPNPYLICRTRAEAEAWIVKKRKGKPMPDPVT